MTMTDELKRKIISEIKKQRGNFAGTDAQFARMLGIRSDIYSRLKNGEINGILKDPNWFTLARKYNIGLNERQVWYTAKTPVFDYITEQLEFCQKYSIGGLFCDRADIGKTHTAKEYVRTHRNAVYIDCSQCKTKDQFIRLIAKEFGVNYMGTQKDVYEDLVFYLQTIECPIIILDEAGDLRYSAFLEIKALWNATEHACAWYLMGADGLKRKISKAITHEKVGFAEIFSREGSRFQRVTPENDAENHEFTMLQAALIIKANAPEENIQKMLANIDGSLRRINTEIKKVKA